MSADDSANPPSAMWAQRASTVLLTICLEDCAKPEIVLKADSLYFSGIGGPDKKAYKLTINFFKEIDPNKSVHAARDRVIEFVLKKKNEEEPFWPRLTKEKVKHHWLKVDFNKWKDEDDSEDEAEGEGMGGMGGMGGFGGDMDLESMMKNMGNPRKPNMDDLNIDGGEEGDSDDEDLPELE